MTQLLLVEDDANLQASLSEFLKDEGFQVTVASTLEEAENKFFKSTEIVILDWMIAGKSGIDLLTKWRRQSVTIPIVMLTAKSTVLDKILGLELGADDYITKPFEPRELLARIRVQLRKVLPQEIKQQLASKITLDNITKEVTYNDKSVELTKMEYHLLKLFLENPRRVFSRDELLNQVWGFDSYPTTRTVDTHVLQLRQKFKPQYFETIRGMGYRYLGDVV